jgi:hypothetical protein
MTEDIVRNEFKQAAKDAKYFGSLFKRMGVLHEMLGEVGDLEQTIRDKRVEAERLTVEVDCLTVGLMNVNAEAAKITADAKAEGEAIVFQARATAKAATSGLAELEAEAKDVETKIANKRALLGEEDQKLRRTREMIADLKKKLPE